MVNTIIILITGAYVAAAVAICIAGRYMED